VIIGGGLVGCETAEFLAAQGKTVTIVEMLDHVAFGIGTSIKVALLYRLNEQKVKILTGVKCSQIIEQGVCIIDKDCTESIIASDTVVLAVGAKPDTTLFQQIQAVVKEIHQVGDCIEARRIINAIADGHRVGLSI
jgi:pyruvate/2-oxoglutarate dehydrogenase complex dihydrolipoamide dehydrogenase (E3) component